NGKLQERRDKRGENREGEPEDHANELRLAASPVVVPSIERHPKKEIREKRDKSHEHNHDCLKEYVAVFYVGKLVSDHPLKLTLVEHGNGAGRRGNRGVLGITAGRKRVRSRIVYHIYLGHRKPRCYREILNSVPEVKVLFARCRPGAGDLQNDLVRIPVAAEIHQDRKDHHAYEYGLALKIPAERPPKSDHNDQEHRH